VATDPECRSRFRQDSVFFSDTDPKPLVIFGSSRSLHGLQNCRCLSANDIFVDVWVSSAIIISALLMMVAAVTETSTKMLYLLLWPLVSLLGYSALLLFVYLSNCGCMDGCRRFEQESDSQIWKKFGSRTKNFGTGAESENVASAISGVHYQRST